MSLCSFHIRSEFIAYPTCCVIYNTVVILSHLTFRGHSKSGDFGVNGFLSSGRSTTFWRPSWACSKVSDPDHWALAPVSRGSRVNSTQQKRNLLKTTNDLTHWSRMSGDMIVGKIVLKDIQDDCCGLILYMSHLQVHKWWKTCGCQNPNKTSIQTSNRLAVSTCLPVPVLLFFIPELRAGMSGVLKDLHMGSAWSAFTQTLSCRSVVAQKTYVFKQHACRGYSSSAGIPGYTGAPL